MKKFQLSFFAVVFGFSVIAQPSHEETIKSIYDLELTEGKSYTMLEFLATKIGARLLKCARGVTRFGHIG